MEKKNRKSAAFKVAKTAGFIAVATVAVLLSGGKIPPKWPFPLKKPDLPFPPRSPKHIPA